MKTIHGYKDLIVWQKAMDLVVEIYTITEQFPRSEMYGLTSQMRRSAVSIPSNIAEGRMRKTKADYTNFLMYSYSSGAELETQLLIAKRLPLGKDISFTKANALLSEVMRMLNTMTNNLRN